MKKTCANVCLFFLIIILFLTGCTSDTSNTTSVRIGYFANITHAQALIMKNSNTLESILGDTYNISWTAFTAGSSEMEALFAGAIDIGYIGPVPAINGNVKSNGEITIITNASDAGAVLVKSADSSIASISDLDGKTVAIPQIGNTQHLCLLNLLSENALFPVSDGGTVEIVAVDNSNLQNMFDQGNIDAALVPEPWGTILTASDDIDILLDYEDIYLNGNYPVALVVVRNEFMEEYPEAVASFLEAHIAATNEINTNLESSVDTIISEIANVTGNTYDKDVVLSAFYKTNITTNLNIDALYSFAQTAYKQDFISELPNQGLVDTSLLENLLK